MENNQTIIEMEKAPETETDVENKTVEDKQIPSYETDKTKEKDEEVEMQTDAQVYLVFIYFMVATFSREVVVTSNYPPSAPS